MINITRLYNRHIISVLLTIVVHLVIGIVFLLLKMSEVPAPPQAEIIAVEFTPEQDPLQQLQEPEPDEKNEAVNEAIEKMMRQEAKSNTGVNVSSRFEKEISTENYLNQMRQQYNIDGFGSDGKENDQPKEEVSDQGNMPDPNAGKSGKSGYYKGPTNIYYDLANRYDMRLIVPVYKCEGTGLVVISIEVNQLGNVVSALVVNAKSVDNDCLIKAATDAARRTRFNADYQKAPVRQKGSITYHFIAQ